MSLIMRDVATVADVAPKSLQETYAYHAQFGAVENLQTTFKEKVAYLATGVALAASLYGAAEIGTNRVIEARGIDISTLQKPTVDDVKPDAPKFWQSNGQPFLAPK